MARNDFSWYNIKPVAEVTKASGQPEFVAEFAKNSGLWYERSRFCLLDMAQTFYVGAPIYRDDYRDQEVAPTISQNLNV